MNVFASREAASREAARRMAAALRARLAAPGPASLVVSGGATPGRCFELLSREELPWSRVQVTLTDERCVPPGHAASNETMLRRCLLVQAAANAGFVPPETAALATLARPPEVALVGMGEDGHFASIFPDNPALASLLDPDSPTEVADVVTGASEYRRRTVSLSFLLQSRRILLLAFGAAKKRILMAPGKLPVAALLQQQEPQQNGLQQNGLQQKKLQTNKRQQTRLSQTRAPVDILWAP